LSSKSGSNSNNKDNINDNNNNSSINPLIEGLALTQSAVVSFIDTYSESFKDAPKMIEYWYNIFLEPWTKTTTTIENQKRDKVKVEYHALMNNNTKNNPPSRGKDTFSV
jgi:hypothetical protein